MSIIVIAKWNRLETLLLEETLSVFAIRDLLKFTEIFITMVCFAVNKHTHLDLIFCSKFIYIQHAIMFCDIYFEMISLLPYKLEGKSFSVFDLSDFKFYLTRRFSHTIENYNSASMNLSNVFGPFNFLIK